MNTSIKTAISSHHLYRKSRRAAVFANKTATRSQKNAPNMAALGNQKMKIALFLMFLSVSSLALSSEKRETDDFNFDGHEDYRVFVMSNGKSVIWEYYLFNPSTKQYDKSDALFSLRNPTFDKNSKRIKTFAAGGHSGKIYVSEVYQWDSDNLMLMKIEKQSWLRKINSYIRVTVERENGEMRVSSIEAIK